jgi:Uma2 family endonuclease
LTGSPENYPIRRMETISRPITLETLLGARKYILIREETLYQLLYYDEEKEGFYRIIISKDKKYTATDYMNLPEGSPFQLIEGELVYMRTPSPKHQKISMILSAEIFNYIKNKELGEVYCDPLSVKFDDDNVVEPDILFVSIKKQAIITEKGIEGTPEFVIEILSKGNVKNDRERKMKMYGNFGVDEYWIINPKLETVEVYYNRLSIMIKQQTARHGDTIKSRVIQGFELEVSRIF